MTTPLTTTTPKLSRREALAQDRKKGFAAKPIRESWIDDAPCNHYAVTGLDTGYIYCRLNTEDEAKNEVDLMNQTYVDAVSKTDQ